MIFDKSAVDAALSKYSSMGSGHLELTFIEQMLVSTCLDISHDYPDMRTHPDFVRVGNELITAKL
jgi:hypothetical protein